MSLRSRCAQAVVNKALEGVTKRAGIHYSQRLALRWVGIDQHMIKGQPPYADCSAYCSWLMWRARLVVRGSAGLDIVNGEKWQAGYTGTMLNHGHRHRFGPSMWNPGRTLVFYGKPTVEHVAVYVGNGKVVSHGSEAGPLLLPWNYRSDFNQARSYGL